jgi:hypothetical protein
MPLSRRILIRWVQLAALATALSLMVYVAVQQVGRQMANDPQIQFARDTRAAIAAGQPVESVVPATRVDIESSLAPFVTIQNDSGVVLASSGRLHGQLRSVPVGVLESVRESGEERVTWQPEPGVRMATVVVRTPGSPGVFVLAGRSLQETEIRITTLGKLLMLAWGATLVGLLVVVAATEALVPTPPGRA